MDYTIKSGDTLSQIAKANNTTVEALAKANQIADPNKIIAGNVLSLPEIQQQSTGIDVSASEITSGIPEIPQAIPEIKSNTSANAILAYTTGEQLKIAEERKQLEETAQKTLGTTNLLEASSQRPTVDLAATRLAEQQKTGAIQLREDVAQQSLKVADIKGERDRLDIMEQNEIDALTKAGVTRGAIERETTAIQRKYASKKAKLSADLNAEASMLAAMQGNYTMAKEAADQAVEDYVFDYKQKVETFDNVFNVYSDLVADLTDRERSILETAAQEAQNELDRVTQEKKEVMSLRLQYAGAGISINDSLEEATTKAENWSKENPTISQTLGSAETGYTMYDKYGNVIGTKEGSSKEKDATIFNSLMQEVINAGGDIYGAVAAANELAQSQYGTSLSISEMNNLLSIASSMTPIETQETQGQTEPTNAIDISKVTGEKTFGIGTAPKKTMGIGSYGTSLQANNINIPKQETRSVGIGAPDTTSWFNQLFSE